MTMQVKAARMRMGQGQLPANVPSKSSLTQASHSKASASRTVNQEPEIGRDPRMDDTELSARTDFDHDQHRERLAAADPSDDGGGGSEAESRSDDEEYKSGAEPESEEDFGVQDVHAPSSRKSVKVAEQLAQGSVKVVSKGRHNRRVLSDSEAGGSDYAPDFLDPGYESPPTRNPDANDSADEAECPVAEDEDDPMNLREARVHREWNSTKSVAQEMIIRRAQRPKLPASRHYGQQDDKKNTPSVEEHPGRVFQPTQFHHAVTKRLLQQRSNQAGMVVAEKGVTVTKTKRQGGFRETDSQLRRSTSMDKMFPWPPPESISSGEDSGLDLFPEKSRTGRPKPRRKLTAPAPSDQSIPGPATNVKGHQATRNGTISGNDDDDDDESATDARGLLRASHVNVWPEDTEVTFKDGNKVAGLNSQKSNKVRTLLKSTIAQELPQALALVNAFPNIGERPKMFLDIFITGARRLGPNYSTIAQRLLQDSAYVLSLLTLPAKRMCSIRGPWYSACRDPVWEGYGLKAIENDPEALQTAVQELLLNDQFIFPGKLVVWIMTSLTIWTRMLTWTTQNGSYTELKRNIPFCAEPIINLANILFLGPKALCPIEDSAFISSINTGPGAMEREIPQTMAALLATFAGAAIGEGLHGTREPLKENEGFNSTKQEAPYRDHLAALSPINLIGRHKILNLIFNEAKFVGLRGYDYSYEEECHSHSNWCNIYEGVKKMGCPGHLHKIAQNYLNLHREAYEGDWKGRPPRKARATKKGADAEPSTSTSGAQAQDSDDGVGAPKGKGRKVNMFDAARAKQDPSKDAEEDAEELPAHIPVPVSTLEIRQKPVPAERLIQQSPAPPSVSENEDSGFLMKERRMSVVVTVWGYDTCTKICPVTTDSGYCVWQVGEPAHNAAVDAPDTPAKSTAVTGHEGQGLGEPERERRWASEAPKTERKRYAPAKCVKEEPSKQETSRYYDTDYNRQLKDSPHPRSTGSGRASRLVQLPPTGSVRPLPVDQNYDEGVAEALMGLPSGLSTLYCGPVDRAASVLLLTDWTRQFTSSVPHNRQPSTSSRASPPTPGTKCPLSTGPDDRSTDMKHSRVGSISSTPGHGNVSALTSLAYPFPSPTNASLSRGLSDWGAEVPSYLWLAGADGEGLSDVQPGGAELSPIMSARLLLVRTRSKTNTGRCGGVRLRAAAPLVSARSPCLDRLPVVCPLSMRFGPFKFLRRRVAP
ncbi:uncharacterized protein B0H18DRAFT_1104765 [Fomitopsis serialis]|uniref:uncharacterized protein n=1 Tax=Fomitopsis serialis TaxID=139415 RepID=UPI00200748F6|nr:uncharacterized protein B0H18DRAFT_1104765 [Neoantrodia serialis]KAH9925091.1 hypothetical protein B0H18DRAFT_1104765 [Neoantrodia serialis]